MPVRTPRIMLVVGLTTLSVVGLVAAGPGAAAAAPGRSANARSAAVHVPPLPLGPRGLRQVQTTSTLTRGVTLTEVTRGTVDRDLRWTLEVAGAAPTSEDPDASGPVIMTSTQAREVAGQVRDAGLQPRIELVRQPLHTDVSAGVLGYRVRVGSYRAQADATAPAAELTAAGLHATERYTGWDESATVRGPWHLNILTVDPKSFRGRLQTSYGADMRTADKPSATAESLGAMAATNASFFVFHADDSDQGTPAGIGVYGGKLLSEPRIDRPGLVLHANGTSNVARYDWRASVVAGGRSVRLDGLNRSPAVIMQCGEPGVSLSAFGTCRPKNNLVEITPEYGSSTPVGSGAEAVLDRNGHVVRVSSSRGTSLAAGQVALQGIGTGAAVVKHWRVGQRVTVRTTLLRDGRASIPSANTSIATGEPALVTDGVAKATIKRDHMAASDDASSSYGFNNERNPRTLAGTDRAGRTVIITCDGRSTTDLGLTIGEESQVAKALGLVNAINLDGGGSTSMSIDGHLINHPSDPAGERPTGDALLVIPGGR